ncbi:MAG: class I SAM-dependent methyltransferase [Thermosynechococcaceae cyanobacterium]
MPTTTQTLDFVRDWTTYYQAVAGRPPRDTLLNALACFESEADYPAQRFAIDLGCGDGRDTVELLRRGWRVLGIDGEPEAIARLQSRPDLDPKALETRVEPFESLVLPASVDLINASFCLPFCPPHAFPSLWQSIVDSLRQGGRFCGQLYGDRDSWASYANVTHHTRSEVEALLHAFALEFFEEEDHPGQTALNEAKHWHLFHIVARKR